MKARYRSLDRFIPWREAERPIDWGRRLGRAAPLEVELGFGNGEFLARRAQAHPERNFVGIEQEWASVYRGLRCLDQAGVANVRLILEDARVALERLFAPQSVQRLYCLFPCPWPKKRHIKHRLFARPFLRVANSRLVRQGEIQLVTDSPAYVDWVLDESRDSGFDARAHPLPASPETKYGRKWSAQGQEVFYELSLLKCEHVEADARQEVAVQIHTVAHVEPGRFHPADQRDAQAIVEFRDFLFDAPRNRAMLRAIAVEQGFTQDFWIEIAKTPGGWRIRPAPGCQVVPTVSVQRALDAARDACLDSAQRQG
jgi:tRNA (guanine-N7-)-methyltransferase